MTAVSCPMRAPGTLLQGCAETGCQPAHRSHVYASLPNSLFRDIVAVYWNWPWCENIHQRTWQMLQIRAPPTSFSPAPRPTASSKHFPLTKPLRFRILSLYTVLVLMLSSWTLHSVTLKTGSGVKGKCPKFSYSPWKKKKPIILRESRLLQRYKEIR